MVFTRQEHQVIIWQALVEYRQSMLACIPRLPWPQDGLSKENWGERCCHHQCFPAQLHLEDLACQSTGALLTQQLLYASSSICHVADHLQYHECAYSTANR